MRMVRIRRTGARKGKVEKAKRKKGEGRKDERMEGRKERNNEEELPEQLET